MNKLLLLIPLLLPILSFSQVITEGLVGYWPFNDNANDESGNGNDGVVNGAVLSNDRYDNPNSAYYFTNNDFISISDIGDHSVYSFSVWVRVDENQDNWNMIFDYGDRRGGVNFVDGTTEIKGFMKNTANGNVFSNTFLLEPNEWHHIVLTVDWVNSKTADLYIDGLLADGNVPLYGFERSGSDLLMGMENGHDYFLNGYIDDLIIYNKVLTHSEVLSIYNNSSTQISCANIICDGENIGIGTPNTHGYKLAVAGNILTEEVKVATQPNWPDYVFEEDYPLAKINELEKYIQENKHLPEIPDAQAIKEEGYNLSEMDAKLLEKIEELTLYIIEQNEKIETQSKENQSQKDRIEILENRLGKLENQLKSN